MAGRDLCLMEAVRVARAYKPGTAACDRFYAYWEEVNATLALMGCDEAPFYEVIRKYEDECSADQAAHEIADPVFGYESSLAWRAEARKAAHSEGSS